MTGQGDRDDRAVERAARATLRWSVRYTAGLDPLVAVRRQEEILSDLHEHAAWATEAGTSPRATARSLRARMLRGIPADLGWRRAQLSGREGVRWSLPRTDGLLLAAVAAIGIVQVAVGAFIAVRQVRALQIGDISFIPSSAALTIALGSVALVALALLGRGPTRPWGSATLALTGLLIFAQSVEALYYLSATALVVIIGVPWLEPAAYAIGTGVAILCLAATAQWTNSARRIPAASAASLHAGEEPR
ncbi:uncharacterized membrane protein YgdD (TMEM256/DUF423 family) [Agromyces flavus]|uniref:Uncharacterized membrane protein YgdD (TMEM256/DUF423 family) n=1 Tax=Agromyces flavus TaxID=589382 RepID=A0A1H1W539_9MICO|nr:hypothetical protein [Agromyces flavus]MCP2366082.1 uncharacterized membrane protein YgdD (TMEM256/DUF423 family) [Agromyces flavus]GGI43967.1 hypothetical protein GCM10010932_02240 [Agromyces flavus]SDS91771.1 hypothetical protein SAMN04489721_2153 [Agromyces flavus]